MNAHQFNDQFAHKVRSERKITNAILRDIVFSEDRKLHLELGFSSLFDWLTRGHGYSESAAQRRIQAARLLRSIPSISDKLESGATNLTNISRAQTVFRAQEKTGVKLSTEDKMQAIEQIENKSGLETEQTLLGLFPEAAATIRLEHKTVIDDQTIRLSLNLSNEDMQNLERARELLSHTLPDATFKDIVSYLAKDFVKRKDPLTQKPATAAPAKQRVTKSARRVTIQKAEGRCEYKDPQTGRVCGSRFRIETDHIRPKSMGGGNGPENLRCLCRVHNQLMWTKWKDGKPFA